MKVRNGFVSNSSSSSFVINKSHLTDFQIWAIKNHIGVGKYLNNTGLWEDYFFTETWHEWNIKETDVEISGYTWMDNFDMEKLMSIVGVDISKADFDRAG